MARLGRYSFWAVAATAVGAAPGDSVGVELLELDVGIRPGGLLRVGDREVPRRVDADRGVVLIRDPGSGEHEPGLCGTVGEEDLVDDIPGGGKDVLAAPGDDEGTRGIHGD